MNFNFQNVKEAAVPSLMDSWKHAVAGAVVGGLTMSVGNAIAGAVVAGLANTGVELYKAATSAPTNTVG